MNSPNGCVIEIATTIDLNKFYDFSSSDWILGQNACNSALW